MKKLLLFLLCLTAVASDSSAAERSVLDFPILFTKRFNYQGNHIYDTFYQWRPGGGIYILENPADAPEKHRIRPVIDATTPVTLGPGIYSDPALSFDAKKILFCYKGSVNGNSTIFEIGLDGKNLRQITNLDKNGNPYKGTGGGHHDVRPAYLGDGKIVFCSTRYSGLVPCANNGVAILHIANADGSDIHTISVNNVTEFDPAPLSDGRILFGRWEYIDKNALTIQSLWTVSPGGMNETALFANNMVFPEAVLQAKPVPGAEHLIVAAFTPHNSPPRGSIAMIDTKRGNGKNDPAAIFNFEHPDRPTFDRGESCDPWAIDANTVIYSGLPALEESKTIPVNTRPFRRRSSPHLNALMLIDRSGKKTLIYGDSKIDIHNPIPILPRPVPRFIPDTSDRSKITGNFFVQNVYANMPNVPKGSVKWLRLVEETSRVSESPGGTWMNQTFSISAALAWSPKIYHGIVPVEKDGSVFFEAPSGRALYFQLLDKDYRLVRSMRTFIQAVPGTTRSCIGCHEYDKAPSTPQFRLTRQPAKPVDESWGSGHLDYPSMIQPILDKRCVSCHGGEKGIAGGLDLSGGWTEYFNISYENLTARREKQYIADLISGICCMNGTAAWSVKIFEPYTHGSGNAPLARMLTAPTSPHREINGLTQTERELLLAWIDSNAIYYGTWDYTKAGPRLKEYAPLKNELVKIMQQNNCVQCHGNNQKQIRRFDDWVNLEKPEMSRILRAPLDPNSPDGYGLGLCRQRKVDSNYSRLGQMFKAGYAHAVLPLEKFPSQKWVPWKESLKGEPVLSFDNTENPVYKHMLTKIREARERQFASPRVDMPNAAHVGAGIIAGRSRQIIPQPLPEKMPSLNVETTAFGVRVSWERSSRTIGLITEIHRGVVPNFTPDATTLVGRTERSEWTDKKIFSGPVYYAIVFISDPAETCGTYRSGETLNYAEPPVASGVSASPTPVSSSVPAPVSVSGTPTASVLSAPTSSVPVVTGRKCIEDRCPLSMVVPMRSEPAWSRAVQKP